MADRLTLAVAGSRDLTDDDYSVVSEAIDWWLERCGWPEVRIIEGGCRGADELAKAYCRARMVSHVQMRADWNRWGKSAGPRRNEEMIKLADGLVVVRFADSRGSADVLSRAEAKGIPIVDRVLERKGARDAKV